jgi:hypothetical protein
MHSARNANDNAILVKVEKRVLSEPDKASITAVQTSARARLPQGHPRTPNGTASAGPGVALLTPALAY